ncbi:hypothetical protein [Eubacterium sp. 1001713B170207_170306_E7]|uniref:hypothetical protein n=1 Tax=Eubacterium sp. 1001713B170207_170306_E7 TaxID=2787097 RepID=UPI00189AE443|nr:hypothetical protein [Eubacterium sp. 1001713B170207_170306_E7]
MDYLIVGINDIDFTDEKTKAHIDGVKIYFVYEDMLNENLQGCIADGKFLQRSLVKKLPFKLDSVVNKHVDIVTDIKGRIVNIIPKETKQA